MLKSITGAIMGRHKAVVAGIIMLSTLACDPGEARAQTFQTYRCIDGTQFIVGFYDGDKRAFVQIDGEPVTLARRMTVSGARYSGAGVTLTIGRTGATVRHLKRPVTSCGAI